VPRPAGESVIKLHSVADRLVSVAPIQVLELALYQTREPRSRPSMVSCFHVATGAAAAMALPLRHPAAPRQRRSTGHPQLPIPAARPYLHGSTRLDNTTAEIEAVEGTVKAPQEADGPAPSVRVSMTTASRTARLVQDPMPARCLFNLKTRDLR